MWQRRTSAVLDEILTLDPEADHCRIVTLSAGSDFLWDTTRALELALFRTFAVPSISSLLDHTRQFADHGQKRYDDTNILILEMLRNGYDSPEGERALAQMNAIHGLYDIANEDFLFVLSTFVLDPIRWNRRFGWRRLTDVEKQAGFLVWQNVGHRMGLSDVPETLAEMERRSDAFVRSRFRYVDSNRRVAEATLRIAEGWLPTSLRGQVEPVVRVLLDEPTRQAFGFAPPSRRHRAAVIGALRARSRLLRYVDPSPDAPWPRGERTYPDGYRIEEVGPQAVVRHLQSPRGRPDRRV